MGYWQSELIQMSEEAWRVRIGQLQTVLSFFGELCSISVERADGVTAYIQAQRADGGLEIEAIGNTYLPERAQLSDAQVASMARLGWTEPQPPTCPNFVRFAPEGADVHEVAVTLARTFDEVYGVRGDETWVVSPPEFGQAGAGLVPFEVVDPDEDPLHILREASGVELAAMVASDIVTFDDCLAAGLPRADRIAEMVMLYRQDCPVEFLRKSSFHLNVLGDPKLPLATARAVLAARPSPYELTKLSARADIPNDALLRAANRGHRLARARGEDGGGFLRLDCVPPQRLAEIAAQQDGEAVGLLGNRRCPEAVVYRHLLAGTARVRYAALAAVKRRNLAIDSALIRAARDLPMTNQTTYPYADRARTIADQILAAR